MKLAIWMKDGKIVRSRYLEDDAPIDLGVMDCLIVPMGGYCRPSLHLTSGQAVYVGESATYVIGATPETRMWGPSIPNGQMGPDIEPPDLKAAALHRALKP